MPGDDDPTGSPLLASLDSRADAAEARLDALEQQQPSGLVVSTSTYGDNNGFNVSPGTVTGVPWVHVSGTELLDLTTPITPRVLESGLYVVQATVGASDPPAVADCDMSLTLGIGSPQGTVPFLLTYEVGRVLAKSLTAVRYMAAGDRIDATVTQHEGSDKLWYMSVGTVIKIG